MSIKFGQHTLCTCWDCSMREHAAAYSAADSINGLVGLTGAEHKRLTDAVAERDALKAQLATAIEAIKTRAIEEVQDELDRGEDCPETWTLCIGGIFVVVHCAEETGKAVRAEIEESKP